MLSPGAVVCHALIFLLAIGAGRYTKLRQHAAGAAVPARRPRAPADPYQAQTPHTEASNAVEASMSLCGRQLLNLH